MDVIARAVTAAAVALAARLLDVARWAADPSPLRGLTGRRWRQDIDD